MPIECTYAPHNELLSALVMRHHNLLPGRSFVPLSFVRRVLVGNVAGNSRVGVVLFADLPRLSCALWKYCFRPKMARPTKHIHTGMDENLKKNADVTNACS